MLAAPDGGGAQPRRGDARRPGHGGRERAGGVGRWRASCRSAAARAELIGSELAAAETDAPAEAVRALRFRLAHHYEADWRFAEALAALTPLRSEGDPLARAWSYELARRSGDAILEVAILSEETRASDGVLGDEAFVRFAHGEALARAGDPHGAAAAFRRALAVGGHRAGGGRGGAGAGAHRRERYGGGPGPRWPMRCARSRRRAPSDEALAAGACARRRCCASPRAGRGEDAAAAPTADGAAARAGGHGGAADAVRRAARRAGGDGRGAARDGAARRARSAASFNDTEPAWKADLLARAVARARLGGALHRRGGRAPRLGDRARAGAGVGAVGPAARGGGRLARRTPRHPPRPRAANRRAVRHRPRSRGGAGRRTAGRAGHGAGDLRQRDRRRSGAAGGVDGDPARRARGRRRDRRSAGAGAAGRGRPRSRTKRRRCSRRRPARTSGRGVSTTRSPRSRSASSCGRTTRRPTCARTSCCAPIWTPPGGRCCSTRCCRTGWRPRR